MATFLITWKPTRYRWSDLQQDIEELRRKGFVDGSWSSGNNKRIRPGDRLFLLRQGSDKPGIVASGWASREPYYDTHFDVSRPDDSALYVGMRFDAILDAEADEILPKASLASGALAEVH